VMLKLGVLSNVRVWSAVDVDLPFFIEAVEVNLHTHPCAGSCANSINAFRISIPTLSLLPLPSPRLPLTRTLRPTRHLPTTHQLLPCTHTPILLLQLARPALQMLFRDPFLLIRLDVGISLLLLSSWDDRFFGPRGFGPLLPLWREEGLVRCIGAAEESGADYKVEEEESRVEP